MASSTGTSHLAATQPCQDSHGCAVVEDLAGRSVVVLVASDGAGTAATADVGAVICCQTFIKLVGDYFSGGGRIEAIGRPLAERWLASIIFQLADHAASRAAPLHDYACTLLGAIVTDGAAVFMQIGDGAIVVSDRHAGDDWRYVFWPQHGEFANMTNFITSENPIEALEFRAGNEAVEEVAIFTDGIENLVLSKADKKVHAPFFDSMFRSVRRSTASGTDGALCRALEQYLSAPPITSRTHDDTTLILASRRRESAV